MADATEWGCAAARALGYTDEAFLDAYAKNVGRQTAGAIEASPVAQALIAFMKDRGGWCGLTSDLFAELKPVAESFNLDKEKEYPRSPAWLWRRLKVVRPNLAVRGLFIERKETERGSLINITSTNISKNAAINTSEPKMSPAQSWQHNADDAISEHHWNKGVTGNTGSNGSTTGYKEEQVDPWDSFLDESGNSDGHQAED